MGIFDRIFTKFEEAGYKAANFTHKVTVSTLAIGSAYGFYALLRDYRMYFKSRKSAEYSENLLKREETIRKIIEQRDNKRIG